MPTLADTRYSQVIYATAIAGVTSLFHNLDHSYLKATPPAFFGAPFRNIRSPIQINIFLLGSPEVGQDEEDAQPEQDDDSSSRGLQVSGDSEAEDQEQDAKDDDVEHLKLESEA